MLRPALLVLVLLSTMGTTFASPATATQHQLRTQDGARRKLLALRTSLAGRLVSARYREAGVTQEDRANFAAIVAHSRVSAKLEGENPGRMNVLLTDSVAIGGDGHVYGLVNDDRSAASVNAFRGMSVESVSSLIRTTADHIRRGDSGQVKTVRADWDAF